MANRKRKIDYAAREAHRKNVERAKQQEQAAKRKAFLEKYRKHLIIGIPAVIVVIVAVWLICKATVGPGGSIPNFFGHLQGVQDNWIVANQGTTSAPRYYKMGEYTAPEGYTMDPEYQVSSDKLDQTMYFTADDENAVIQSIYIAGVHNRTAADMVDMAAGFSMFAGDVTRSEESIGGLTGAHWLLGTVNDAEATAETEEDAPLEIGHMQMNVYVESVQDSCVLVFMNSRAQTAAAEIPSQEDFLAAAEEILKNLTVEK